MRTRVAPTPSGYLHKGNVVNFALVDAVARSQGCDIALRIDDLDTPRVRPEFVEDIFRVLEWLAIEWQVGPRSAADLDSWSQTNRMHRYARARDALVAQTEQFYGCGCYRQNRMPCRCACAERAFRLETNKTSLRMRWRSGPDPVVWRRDGLPAFHLASVVDDHLLGVTHVVRGEDLRESTEFQRELSRFLPGNHFAEVRVVHHPLVLDRQGCKLSKSAGAGAAPMVLDLELCEEVRVIAAHFRTQLDEVSR